MANMERNPGLPLDLAWVNSVRVNLPAVKRRAETLGTRRTVKKEWQAAWMLRAISCIDLTTLAGDDTAANVARLCHKAARPVRADIVEALGVAGLGVRCGAVCVYPSRVADAVATLKKIGAGDVPVAAVATGFPSGQFPLKTRLEEIRMAVAAGASEIDIVISREKALVGDWQTVYDEVKLMRDACGDAHMKAILAVGELASLVNVYKASLVCMMAGADFIKTSTGKESVNAVLPVGVVMCRAIREYHERTGHKIGFKPAGGIRTAKDGVLWLILMKEELGNDWLNSQLFRIGASSLLGDIERQLFHHAFNRYAAASELPMA
ncbi:deoxyribose-phosphate aldolase-like [Pollicipes pollicipes]|uniref:deoxyribose-phosphate aldolase-like n=1 Tax=Pollicipes pollicipes TaxID=41117 RepID=UPI001884D29C|nr:deoxyribose-phosphate aldolase-like [Pollicipes pollicipes]XP_037080229.1 deoxyribose-phosphate aldolase-like [Pollicipes pollicipes]